MAFISSLTLRAQPSPNSLLASHQCGPSRWHLRMHMGMGVSRREVLKQLSVLAAVATTARAAPAVAAMYSADTKASFDTKGDPKKLAT